MKKALFIIAALASCMTVSAKYWFGGSIGFDTESYYYNITFLSSAPWSVWQLRITLT